MRALFCDNFVKVCDSLSSLYSHLSRIHAIKAHPQKLHRNAHQATKVSSTTAIKCSQKTPNTLNFCRIQFTTSQTSRYVYIMNCYVIDKIKGYLTSSIYTALLSFLKQPFSSTTLQCLKYYTALNYCCPFNSCELYFLSVIDNTINLILY